MTAARELVAKRLEQADMAEEGRADEGETSHGSGSGRQPA